MSQRVIQYSGSEIGQEERDAVIEVLNEGWLGLAKRGREFEQKLAKYFDRKDGVFVNSGSSANLLTVDILKSKNFRKRLRRGDGIITPLCGFPTTLNPILQCGFTPVLIDVELGTYNINSALLDDVDYSKVRAMMIPHAFGNPADMDQVMALCRKHDLILIEDCCDALGATYHGRPVGSFGDFATLSMYPAHHITTGEGGFITAGNMEDLMIIRALRDWGRGCYCYGTSSLAQNGMCGKRFSKWLDGIDEEIDHKYVYEEIGYHFAPTEMQAAIGLAQIKYIAGHIAKRKENFKKLNAFFTKYEDYFVLPRHDPKSDPSWFVYPLTIKADAPFKRQEIVYWLEEHKIQTRPLFAGNLLRHPAYRDIEYTLVGDTSKGDLITTNSFFIGVYQGITSDDHIRINTVVDEFMKNGGFC